MALFGLAENLPGRLFPFNLLLTDDKGDERKCQGKSFNVGDPEIPTVTTSPITIFCKDGLLASSVKLVGLKEGTILNICEVQIFGY